MFNLSLARKWFSRLGALTALACAPASAANFAIDRWILTFEPHSGKVSQVVTYKYAGGEIPVDSLNRTAPARIVNAPVPVEISIAAREITLDGKVTYPSSQGAEDFIVYPAQFILYPGDSKKVQIQWVGGKPPVKETAFGFISTQLPIDVEEKPEEVKGPRGYVSILSRYEGILVVKPANVKPETRVDTVYSRVDTAGTHMVLILNNKGTGLQSLKGMSLTASAFGKGGKIDFSQRFEYQPRLSAEVLNKSIFAGYRRKVDFPWPPGLPVGPVNVTVTFPLGAK